MTVDKEVKNEEKNDIDSRLKILIEHKTEKMQNAWKTLENETGVNSQKWRQFHRGATKASSEMIEAAARTWPDFAYWLTTSDTEPECGHIAPPTIKNAYPTLPGTAQKWATIERLYKQKLLLKMPTNNDEREQHIESIRNEVFKVKEKQKMPAVTLCFERIMHTLKAEIKDEYFLTEYNKELREIRIERYKEASEIQKKIYTERVHISQSVVIESALDKFLSAIKFWK